MSTSPRSWYVKQACTVYLGLIRNWLSVARNCNSDQHIACMLKTESSTASSILQDCMGLRQYRKFAEISLHEILVKANLIHFAHSSYHTLSVHSNIAAAHSKKTASYQQGHEQPVEAKTRTRGNLNFRI
jgi:hypothetical protein